MFGSRKLKESNTGKFGAVFRAKEDQTQLEMLKSLFLFNKRMSQGS